MRWTVQQAAAAVRSVAARSPERITLRGVVEGRFGSGLVLSALPERPEVLGLSAVDCHGDAAGLILYGGEVGQLRDALTAWLETWDAEPPLPLPWPETDVTVPPPL